MQCQTEADGMGRAEKGAHTDVNRVINLRDLSSCASGKST